MGPNLEWIAEPNSSSSSSKDQQEQEENPSKGGYLAIRDLLDMSCIIRVCFVCCAILATHSSLVL